MTGHHEHLFLRHFRILYLTGKMSLYSVKRGKIYIKDKTSA